MNPETQNHEWHLRGESSDLTKVPIPIMKDNPVQSWSGKFSVEAEASKKGASEPWLAKGLIDLQQIKMTIDWNQKASKVTGPVAIDFKTNFLYGKNLTLDQTIWKVDLTDSEIAYEDLFKKPPKVAFSTEGSGGFDQNFLLKNLHFQLATLSLNAAGTLSIHQKSYFQLQVLPTNLSGFEKYVLPLSKYPLQGNLELSSRISGTLAEPKELSISLAPLILKNIRGAFEWQSADKTISLGGPFVLDFTGKGQIEKFLPQSLEAKGQGDLSGMEISYKDLFKKTKGQLLKVDLSALHTPTGTKLQNTKIMTGFGDIHVAGEVPMDFRKALNVQVDLKNFDFDKMAGWIPLVKTYVQQGQANASLKLNGSLNQKDFFAKPAERDRANRAATSLLRNETRIPGVGSSGSGTPLRSTT